MSEKGLLDKIAERMDIKSYKVRHYQCPKCKKLTGNRYLFEGEWYCFNCVKKLNKERDARYTKKLLEGFKE